MRKLEHKWKRWGWLGTLYHFSEHYPGLDPKLSKVEAAGKAPIWDTMLWLAKELDYQRE